MLTLTTCFCNVGNETEENNGYNLFQIDRTSSTSSRESLKVSSALGYCTNNIILDEE